MRVIDEESWEPWLKEFMDKNELTVQSVMDSQAPLMLARALNNIIKSRTPPAALKEEGFDKLPAEIQLLFYGRMGQALLSAIWAGVKDVSMADDTPPPTIEILLEEIQSVYEEFFTDDRSEG